MATILSTKSVYFNDCTIIPKVGKVKSRKDVPNEMWRVICSPMGSIIGESFITEAAKLGLSITLPRFIDSKKKIQLYEAFETNRSNQNQLCFISIGMHESDSEISELEYIHPENWLIDVANGYSPLWLESVRNLSLVTGRDSYNLMVGNVVTSGGVDYLISKTKSFCSKLFIRSGIGNGFCCQTSDVTGFNRGQITELLDCSQAKEYIKNEDSCFLVSDGGIDRGGSAMKAWGVGADYVMMGGYFSNAEEAETNISGDGIYYGCASDKQNKLAGLDKHSEGKVSNIDKSKLQPLSHLVKELWGGISSGVSYSGYETLSEFIGNATLEIKVNSLPPKKRN